MAAAHNPNAFGQYLCDAEPNLLVSEQTKKVPRASLALHVAGLYTRSGLVSIVIMINFIGWADPKHWLPIFH